MLNMRSVRNTQHGERGGRGDVAMQPYAKILVGGTGLLEVGPLLDVATCPHHLPLLLWGIANRSSCRR